MKRILIALVALATVASAACRQYDVDVYRDVNGKVPQGENYGVCQRFICTADSLLWAEVFIGAPNSGGSYSFEVRDLTSNQDVYSGETAVAGQNYEYVRANLQKHGLEPLIKGKEYVLKVTLSNSAPTESLNFYYDPTNPYKYGNIQFPDFGYHPPPEPWEPDSDLCCRIEGINRPVSKEFFGGSDNMPWLDSTRRGRLLSLAESAGVTWIRHGVMLTALDSCPDHWNWTNTDPIFGAFYHHHMNTLAVLGDCQAWLSTRCTLATVGDSRCWCATNKGPPRGLLNSVFDSTGHINPNNFWADIVYRTVARYKLNGIFFGDSLKIHDYGITDWEIWNEPQFWRPPQRGYDSLCDTFPGDSVALVEYLYARLCVVSCSAARAADTGAHVIIGGGLSDVFAHKHDGSVDGATWLAGFYRYGGCGGMDSGASVHPYQADSLGLTPDLFAHDLDTIRTIRRLNGDEGKELLATEAAYGQDSIQAAISLPETYTLSLAGSPVNFYDRIFWFVLHDDRPPESSWCSQMLHLNQDSTVSKKTCFYAYQQMDSELLGKRMNGRVLSGDSAIDAKTRVYELEDTVSGKKTWVGWRNYATGAAAVRMRIPTRTDRLDIAPLARSADPDRLNRSATARKDGWLALMLDTIPAYAHETGTRTRPDLVVDSLWTVENQDAGITLHARVKNIGNAQFVSSGKKGSVLHFAIDGAPVDPVAEPKELAPGGIAVVRSAPLSPDRSVAHLVSATANPDKDVMELNFDNNGRYCPLSAH